MLVARAHSVPGTLRQEVVIDGRHRLATDEPPELGGDGSAPAPHELLPAALASCLATTLAVYARNKGWDLGSVDVDVSYHQRATPRRFEVVIRLGGDVTSDMLERLEKVAAACPVRRSLQSGAEFDERIETEEGRTPTAPGSRPCTTR
jgi:putative redox protein